MTVWKLRYNTIASVPSAFCSVGSHITLPISKVKATPHGFATFCCCNYTIKLQNQYHNPTDES